MNVFKELRWITLVLLGANVAALIWGEVNHRPNVWNGLATGMLLLTALRDFHEGRKQR